MGMVDIIKKDDEFIIKLKGRIDSKNSGDCDKAIFDELNDSSITKIKIDMDELEYISSAGLRILMKIAKQNQERLTISNVNRDIYDILEMTGFTELFDVNRKLRNISVDGCEIIGQGANGAVYRLDADTVIKVYQPGTPIEDVNRERNLAHAAFVKGIPTAISYDVVNVEDKLGIVFELLNAQSLSSVIDENPERFDELAQKYVDTYKAFHTKTDDKNEFPKVKDIYNIYIDGIVDWYTEDEIKKLRELVASVPERNTLIHGDFHAHNIMYAENELIMIDMGDVSVGHPIFDFLATAATQANLVDLNPEYAQIHTGMKVEYIKKLWNTLLRLYFDGKSDEEIALLDKQIRLMSKLKVAFAPVIARGIPMELIQSSVDDAKINLIPHIDELIGKIDW